MVVPSTLWLTPARLIMLNILITGTSRGLGLELVKQLASNSDTNGGLIVATARNCSSDLQEVISLAKGSVIFAALDVTDKETIAQSAEKVSLTLAGRSLDILINCAGVHGETHGKLALMYETFFRSVFLFGDSN